VQTLIGWITAAALAWICKQIPRWVQEYLASRKAKEKIHEENAKAREKSEAAKTDEEREDAAESTIRNW
jgi:hypothetical protein